MLVSVGCVSPEQSSSPARPASSDVSDAAIAEALYRDQRTPPEFYAESVPREAFYTITHVTSAHTGEPGPARRHCADDFAEAAALAEQAAAAQPIYRDLVDTRRAPLFFEFTRVSPAQPQVVQLLRVFACDYLRPGGSTAAPDTIVARPLDAAMVRYVAEYEWWASPANNFGTAVLEASVETLPSQFAVTFRTAELGGAEGGCDIVDLWLERRLVDGVSGEIRRDRVWQRAFRAKFDAGVVTLCSN